MAVTLSASYQLIASKSTSTYSTLRLYAKLNSQDTTNNKSNITLQARLYGNGGGGSFSSGSIKLATTEDNSTTSLGNTSYSKGSETTLKTWTTNVSHASDGNYTNKTISATLTSTANPNGTASGTISIKQIPRKSKPTATINPVAIGSTTRINTNRASGTSFTHNLYYTFGNLPTTLIATGVTDYYNWTIPSGGNPDFIGQFSPYEKQKNCTITCETFNGATSLGSDNSLVLGITLPDSSKPTYTTPTKSETNTDVSDLIGSSMTKAIINLSKPRYQTTLSSHDGAYLKSVNIKCGDLSDTIDLTTSNITTYNLDYTFVNAMTSNKVEITITDTRELSTPYVDDYSNNYAEYTKPTITNQELERSGLAGDVSFKLSGTMQPKQLDGTTNNSITATYKYKLNETGADYGSAYPLSVTYNGNNDEWSINQIEQSFALYNKSWKIEVTIKDACSPSSPLVKEYTINKAVPTMSLGENDLQVNGDLYLADEDGQNIIDIREALKDSGWQNITLPSGITANTTLGGTPQCRKIGNHVFVRGGYAGTKGSSGLKLGTLPSEWKPTAQLYWLCAGPGARVYRVFINTSAEIWLEWIYPFGSSTAWTGAFAWLDFEADFFID